MTKVICKNRKPLLNKDFNGLWTGSEITRRCSGRGAEILYHKEMCYENTIGTDPFWQKRRSTAHRLKAIGSWREQKQETHGV